MNTDGIRREACAFQSWSGYYSISAALDTQPHSPSAYCTLVIDESTSLYTDYTQSAARPASFTPKLAVCSTKASENAVTDTTDVGNCAYGQLCECLNPYLQYRMTFCVASKPL